MSVSYVLISVAPKYLKNVYKSLENIEEIIELTALFGEYDIIAKIQVEDVEKLANIIINKIRVIEGIVDTKTLRGVKLQGKTL